MLTAGELGWLASVCPRNAQLRLYQCVKQNQVNCHQLTYNSYFGVLMRSKNIQQCCQSRCVVRRHSKEKAQVSQWFLAIVGVGDAYNQDNIRLTILDVTQINRNNQALVLIGRSSEFSIPVQILAIVIVTGCARPWTLTEESVNCVNDVYMGRHATYIHRFTGHVR